jgi:hypothetical protein
LKYLASVVNLEDIAVGEGERYHVLVQKLFCRMNIFMHNMQQNIMQMSAKNVSPISMELIEVQNCGRV